MSHRLGIGAGVLAAVALGATGCAGPLLYEGTAPLAHEPIEVRLLRITEDGLVPDRPLRLLPGQGGVAFTNETAEPVSIVWPRDVLPQLRCAYTNRFESDDAAGATFTGGPLAPGEVGSLCLHAAGSFRFEVHRAGRPPLEGRIEATAPVEEVVR